MTYFKNLLRNIDKILILMPIFFAIISIVMIGSISYKGEFIINKDIIVQSTAYGVGIVAILVILMFEYKSFEALEKFLYGGSILFLLTVYIPGLGLVQYGARSWIDLGPVNLQPSEIVKITFILAYAAYLSRNRQALSNFKGVFMAFLYAAPFILIVIKEDLGGAIIYIVVVMVMVFYAGMDYKILAKLALFVVVAAPITYRFMAPHQKVRIDAFLNPDNLSFEGNYQVWNSKVAIGSGGFWGKGLFQGTQKELKFLPVQKSDFIFSVIVEEFGMIGGATVLFLYTIFLYRILSIADKARDMYGALITIGFFAMFGFQIFENIAMSMGVMPVTGITLPFISYGGSSVVANMIAVGFVLNVGIRSKPFSF